MPGTTAHERKMDSLAIKVGKALHGETLEDAAYVCAAIISHAIMQLPKPHRDRLRHGIASFIDEMVGDASPKNTSH